MQTIANDTENWFEWDLLHFDKMKEFHRFYPKNNIAQVLEDMPKPKVLEAVKEKLSPSQREKKIKQSINRSKEIMGEVFK